MEVEGSNEGEDFCTTFIGGKNSHATSATHERLPVALGCFFCGSTDMETRDHIMWECTYVLRFWSGLWAQLHLLVRHEDGIAEAWIQGRRSLTREARRLWDMTWAARAWTLERKEIGEPSQDQPSLERGLLDFASACYALLATVFNK